MYQRVGKYVRKRLNWSSGRRRCLRSVVREFPSRLCELRLNNAYRQADGGKKGEIPRGVSRYTGAQCSESAVRSIRPIDASHVRQISTLPLIPNIRQAILVYHLRRESVIGIAPLASVSEKPGIFFYEKSEAIPSLR